MWEDCNISVYRLVGPRVNIYYYRVLAKEDRRHFVAAESGPRHLFARQRAGQGQRKARQPSKQGYRLHGGQ